MSAEFDNESRGGYEDSREYDRERSGSPRARSSNGNRMRSRSGSPNGRMDSRPPASDSGDRRDKEPAGDKDEARNSGTNLFVTGIHPKLTEEDVTRLFSKYGDVVKCNIMLDPHTKESRGFGFVNFNTGEQADAAKDALQGEVYEGRTLSIEKARRSRPRTPTPGKYFGPPKREDEFRRGPPPYRSYRGSGGGYSRHGGHGGYEDDRYYRSSRYESGDRYYGGSRRDHQDDYPPRIDRYASREDRYAGSSGREDRRGYYDRDGGRGGGGGYESRREPASMGTDDRAAEPARGERERGYYGDREDRYRR